MIHWFKKLANVYWFWWVFSLLSGAISEIFVTNINADIKCYHGYPYLVIKGKMLKCINKESW